MGGTPNETNGLTPEEQAKVDAQTQADAEAQATAEAEAKAKAEAEEADAKAKAEAKKTEAKAPKAPKAEETTVTFTCEKYPDLFIKKGGVSVRFNAGKLVTDDESVIAAVKESASFRDEQIVIEK